MKYTYKTKEGRKARVIATNIDNEFSCVIAVEILGGSSKEIVLLARLAEDSNIITPAGTIFKEFDKWEEVAVDTPIWVRDVERVCWVARHFAKYEAGCVYAWRDGTTSHSSASLPKNKFRTWNFATMENPNAQEIRS